MLRPEGRQSLRAEEADRVLRGPGDAEVARAMGQEGNHRLAADVICDDASMASVPSGHNLLFVCTNVREADLGTLEQVTIYLVILLYE